MYADPDKIEIDLWGNEKEPKYIKKLKVLKEDGEKSHYERYTKKILQCSNCSTYYLYKYFFDNEDSPSTPTTETAARFSPRNLYANAAPAACLRCVAIGTRQAKS